VLVHHLARAGWTVEQTVAHVGKVKALASALDGKGVADWLPLDDVVTHHLVTLEFSPRTVDRLLAVAEEIFGWIERNGTPRDAHGLRRWLVDNAGDKAWEPRELNAYLQRLIAGQYVVKGWRHGNWRDHVGELDDGSVALLLTDPPYGQGFRSDYRLDRGTAHRHELIAGDDHTALDEFALMLKEIRGKLARDAHLLVFCGWRSEPEFRDVIATAGFAVRGSIVWDKQATGMGDPDTTFAPAHERIVHAVAGSPLLYSRCADVVRCPRQISERHPTEKPEPLLAELIKATTVEGQLVADPYGGVASTAAAAKATDRRWWSCEIDETYWRHGEERLS
ncbi:MAG: DNA-methyltransferase, partial [Sciscionella sp.]